MPTEVQVLAQFRRQLLGALLFVTVLGACATVLLATPHGTLPGAPLVAAMLVPVLAALGAPLQRMRRSDPALVQRLRDDEWRALGMTRAWRNGLVVSMCALPLLAIVITGLGLPNGVAVLAASGCTLAAAAFLLTILWHERG